MEFRQLSAEVRNLAGQLRAIDGRASPVQRVLRAFRAGELDQEVVLGTRRFPAAFAALEGLSTRAYGVLADHQGEGPWICHSRAAYIRATSEPGRAGFDPRSVSRAFASEVEVRAYLAGAGHGAGAPPEWQRLY